MISAAKEDATDSAATTAPMSMIATCTTEQKPTEEEEAKTTGLMTFKEMAEDTIGSPYHEIFFMTGKEIRDRGDREMVDAYTRLRTLTDQNYVPRKRRIVKPAMTWKIPDQKISKSNAFFFNGKTTSPISIQGANGRFVFGAEALKL